MQPMTFRKLAGTHGFSHGAPRRSLPVNKLQTAIACLFALDHLFLSCRRPVQLQQRRIPGSLFLPRRQDTIPCHHCFAV
jgi:hypothetical protein